MRDVKPQSLRVDLGPLSLDPAPGWRFYPINGRVVGRPENRVGVLTITEVPDEALPAAASHEQCMSTAVAASGYTVEPPGFDRAKEFGDACMAGGESYRSGRDFVRVWYRRCAGSIVVAWYGCKGDRACEHGVIESIRDCDRMIATARVPPPTS
jgi:hypothetical protein